MSTGDKRFCKTCNLWISAHTANVLRHETSSVHKMNLQRKIREADEFRKSYEASEKSVIREIYRASVAAQAPVNARPGGHSLDTLDELEVSSTQTEAVWMTCRTEQGRIYYANRITGESQWHKPPELGGVPEAPRPEPQSQPPPKPRVVSAAPPRPKTGALKPPPRPSAAPASSEGKKMIESLLKPEEVREGADPSTGFGDWESVESPPSNEPDKVVLSLPARELKRINAVEEVGFSTRTVTKKSRRTTTED